MLDIVIHARSVAGTLAFVALAGALACGGEPLVFPDWTVDIPEGMPIHGYAGTLPEERTQRIELVEDLVLAPNEPEIAFYRPWHMGVDGDHNIYVADSGQMHVLVFDRDGNLLRTFGRQGAGPGEFVSSQGLYVSGSRVVLGDWRAQRLNLWDLAGNPVDDIVYGSRQLVDTPGTPWSDDSFVATSIIDDRGEEYDAAIERYGFDLEVTVRYTVYTSTRNIAVGDRRIHDPSVRALYAVEPGGNVYFTRGDQAQVIAFDEAGAPAWAARTTWRAPPVTDDVKRRIMGIYYNPEGMTLGSPGWPETLSAVSRMAVDGDGRLWLYLREGYDNPQGDQYLPVDVFDRGGERLCACLAPNVYWTTARDDYVLANSPDPETEETRVVRYRVEMPSRIRP